MPNLNGRIKRLEEQSKPPETDKLRTEEKDGKIYVFWGKKLVKVVPADLWESL